MRILSGFSDRFVSQSPDSDDLKVRIVPEPFSETVDMYVYGAFIAFRVRVPEFTHELTPGERLVGKGQKLEQKGSSLNHPPLVDLETEWNSFTSNHIHS